MKVPTALTFLAAACVFAAFAVLQANGFSLLGVKPNMVLAAIAVSAFFIENIWLYLLLVGIAGFILKFAPGFHPEFLLLYAIGVLAHLLGKYLPWHALIGSLLIIIFGTLLFYSAFGAHLIMSAVFMKEIVLTMAVGVIIFALFLNLWDNTK